MFNPSTPTGTIERIEAITNVLVAKAREIDPSTAFEMAALLLAVSDNMVQALKKDPNAVDLETLTELEEKYKT